MKKLLRRPLKWHSFAGRTAQRDNAGTREGDIDISEVLVFHGFVEVLRVQCTAKPDVQDAVTLNFSVGTIFFVDLFCVAHPAPGEALESKELNDRPHIQLKSCPCGSV